MSASRPAWPSFGRANAGSGAAENVLEPPLAARPSAASRPAPHGTAGSLAYSQADVLTLVQLASVTGLAGVTFLVMALSWAVQTPLSILLGVFLRSTSRPITNWTFEDTLTQIGLGYGFLFLVGFRPVRDQWIALAVLLVGYWAAFALVGKFS